MNQNQLSYGESKYVVELKKKKKFTYTEKKSKHPITLEKEPCRARYTL